MEDDQYTPLIPFLAERRVQGSETAGSGLNAGAALAIGAKTQIPGLAAISDDEDLGGKFSKWFLIFYSYWLHREADPEPNWI
jgi:hypothetical protein